MKSLVVLAWSAAPPARCIASLVNKETPPFSGVILRNFSAAPPENRAAWSGNTADNLANTENAMNGSRMKKLFRLLAALFAILAAGCSGLGVDVRYLEGAKNLTIRLISSGTRTDQTINAENPAH